MGEFVKKTLMGYKEVPDGQSDPECTHVILTETEYAKLQRKISDAEQLARQRNMKQSERLILPDVTPIIKLGRMSRKQNQTIKDGAKAPDAKREPRAPSAEPQMKTLP